MKNKKWIVAGGLIIAAGLVCGRIGLKSYLDEKNAGKGYDDLREEAMVSVTPSPKPEITDEPVQEPEEEPESEEKEEREPVEIPIDFESLQSKYPDIYAWITIPGTDINYPIVQREGDNSYYLNHTVEGDKKIEGAIFTEDYNSKDFTDPNTVIYGHNMKNGSMFRQLHNYDDRKFFKENREVLVYQPGTVLHYQIFAAYVFDSRHLMLSYDFTDPDVYEAYIESIFSRKGMGNNIDNSVEVTREDRIITLSTCNGNDDQRYIVQAVLLSIEN